MENSPLMFNSHSSLQKKSNLGYNIIVINNLKSTILLPRLGEDREFTIKVLTRTVHSPKKQTRIGRGGLFCPASGWQRLPDGWQPPSVRLFSKASCSDSSANSFTTMGIHLLTLSRIYQRIWTILLHTARQFTDRHFQPAWVIIIITNAGGTL